MRYLNQILASYSEQSFFLVLTKSLRKLSVRFKFRELLLLLSHLLIYQ